MLIVLDLYKANGSNDDNEYTYSVESHTHFKSNEILFQTSLENAPLKVAFSATCACYLKGGDSLLINSKQ